MNGKENPIINSLDKNLDENKEVFDAIALSEEDNEDIDPVEEHKKKIEKYSDGYNAIAEAERPRDTDSEDIDPTKALLKESEQAQEEAYCPYSEFPVGCAIRGDNGEIYTGCNIENMNYTNTLHAEQVALGKAVSDGVENFEAVAITVSDKSDTPPCGLCRESLVEHTDLDTLVLVNLDDDDYARYTLGELLPDDMRQQNNLDEEGESREE